MSGVRVTYAGATGAGVEPTEDGAATAATWQPEEVPQPADPADADPDQIPIKTKPSMIPFPKIEQFRQVCSEVAYLTREDGGAPRAEGGGTDGVEVGVDGDGDEAAVFAELPTVEFVGTVKLHGTNAAVCVRGADGPLWAQSRKNVLSKDRDNAGFHAHFIESWRDYTRLLHRLWAAQASIDPDERFTAPGTALCVYGEWCGKGIQPNVAISTLGKRFVVFDAAFTGSDGEFIGWMDPATVKEAVVSERNPTWLIHHTHEFPNWRMTIDFQRPKLAQNDLVQLTDAVEKECPVAAALGASGTGEGVVWTGTVFGKKLRFKVKGDKHSVSKVTTLASVDVEKLESIEQFVEYACTPNRMEQGFDELFTKKGVEPTMKNTIELIRWCNKDILDEETDTLEKNGLQMSDVGRAVSQTVVRWFKVKMLAP